MSESEYICTKRVMIIEDNEISQELAKRIIEQLGHTVLQLFEGKNAVEKIRELKPDLIILDIMLPDASGIEICRKLKDDPELKKIFVIIVTALGSDEDKKRIVAESGCNNYIIKPIIPRLFAAAIGRYVHIRDVDGWIQ